MFNRERFWNTGEGNPADMPRSIVEPAFASSAQALCFVLLVAIALSLPVLVDSSVKVDRQRSYDLMPEQHGPYSYMKKEIFETSGDIDLLFIGSSVLWNAVDTPQVKEALSQSLGREATVMTLGFNFNGADIPYTILRDLVERRRVRLVVLSIPRLSFTDGPSTPSYRFLRYAENPEIVAGLPFGSRVSLYASNVLRSPRDILAMIRPERSPRSPYADDLGANKERLGMYRDPNAFVRFAPAPPVLAAESLIYSPSTEDDFRFTNEELPPHQDHYLTEFMRLLRERDIPLAVLNVPQYSERSNDKAVERFDWSAKFGSHVPLIGVSPKTLFAGLDESEVELLHCDREHFNLNGNEYFTRSIIPALLTVHREHASKDF